MKEDELIEQMFNALLGTAEEIIKDKELLPPGPIGLAILGAACVHTSIESWLFIFAPVAFLRVYHYNKNI